MLHTRNFVCSFMLKRIRGNIAHKLCVCKDFGFISLLIRVCVCVAGLSGYNIIQHVFIIGFLGYCLYIYIYIYI